MGRRAPTRRVRLGNDTMAEQPKYDVAVSFLAQDEPLALELSQTLAGRMTLFVYSERQRDLAGREGMSEFTRIFERESRLVVVLFRKGWGPNTLDWRRADSHSRERVSPALGLLALRVARRCTASGVAAENARLVQLPAIRHGRACSGS